MIVGLYKCVAVSVHVCRQDTCFLLLFCGKNANLILLLNMQCVYEQCGRVEKTVPALRTSHWPPLCRLPCELLCGLPYGLATPQATLNKQPNFCLGGKETQQPTCSTYMIIIWLYEKQPPIILFTNFLEPVFFSFSPHFFIGHLNQNAVLISKHRWISISFNASSVCHWH